MNVMPSHEPHIEVTLSEGPLAPISCGAEAVPDPRCTIGAVVFFEGIVRAQEGERTIVALDYEAYRPMADRSLEQLARAVALRHGLQRVVVEHSVGRVAVGARSFRLTVESAHRVESLRAMSEFIDQMKLDVPLWKRAVY